MKKTDTQRNKHARETERERKDASGTDIIFPNRIGSERKEK